MLLVWGRHARLDQSYFHGCASPLLNPAKEFESTSRTLAVARAADSAATFCAELCTLPLSVTWSHRSSSLGWAGVSPSHQPYTVTFRCATKRNAPLIAK